MAYDNPQTRDAIGYSLFRQGTVSVGLGYTEWDITAAANANDANAVLTTFAIVNLSAPVDPPTDPQPTIDYAGKHSAAADTEVVFVNTGNGGFSEDFNPIHRVTKVYFRAPAADADYQIVAEYEIK